MKTYTAIVERCPETGLYVGFVTGFPGAHTQAESLDELNQNLKEVIGMLLKRQFENTPKSNGKFKASYNSAVLFKFNGQNSCYKL
ncbi:MAG: type II toxin-antitoxin system HicB family antitoxin [Methylovulum sp.]|nr:type II toxin-antitoxin system HicB family antitoxin [Methylovulum sp.]